MSAETEASQRLAIEVARRRTFAIISHPDAGKTTLTEKFLLYSGAVQVAGAVHAREGRRSSRSDWNTSASRHSARAASSPFSARFSRASASAAAPSAAPAASAKAAAPAAAP